jgi:hypothetical protein
MRLVAPITLVGIDRLVGGNHDEALRPALTRHPRRMQGTQHVGAQGLDLVEFLHQRHVLVGGRMEDYRRFVRCAIASSRADSRTLAV